MSSSRSGEVTLRPRPILAAGLLTALWGLSALAVPGSFETDALLIESVTTWGWLHVVLALLQVGVAAMVFGGRGWATRSACSARSWRSS